MIAEKRLVIIAYLFLILLSYGISFSETFPNYLTTPNSSAQVVRQMMGYGGSIYTSYDNNYYYRKGFWDNYEALVPNSNLTQTIQDNIWSYVVSKNFTVSTGPTLTSDFPNSHLVIDGDGLHFIERCLGGGCIGISSSDGTTGQRIVLNTRFNNTMSLGINSTIAIDIKIISDNKFVMYFSGSDINNSFAFADDCMRNDGFMPTNFQCCSLFSNLSGANTYYFNLKVSDISTICDGTLYKYMPSAKNRKDITQINFIVSDDAIATYGTDLLAIDNINIDLTDIEDNQLPSIDSFNITSDECINTSTQDSITADYELSISDPEGDKLYYSAGEWDSNYNYKIFVYSKHFELSLGDIVGFKMAEELDKDIFSYVKYLKNNTCEIAEESLGAQILSGNNYFPFVQKQGLSTVNGVQSVGYDVWQLSLDASKCDGDKSFTYGLNSPEGNMLYRSDFWGLDTAGEKFNITFFNSELDPISILNFEAISSTVVNVSYVNSTGQDVFMFNITNYPNFAVQIYNSTLEFWNLQYIGIQENETFTRLLINNSVKYITIGINSNTHIYQGGFSHSGMQDVLSWSETVPTSISNVHQDFYTCLYITDEMHKDTNNFVYECKHFAPQVCNSQDVDSGTLGGNPIVTPLRNIFSPIIDGFGMRSVIEGLNWLIFICLFLGLFILFRSFGFAYFVTTFFCLFLSLIGFGNLTHIITYTILLALGLTPYVVQLIFPIQRGGS